MVLESLLFSKQASLFFNTCILLKYQSTKEVVQLYINTSSHNKEEFITKECLQIYKNLTTNFKLICRKYKHNTITKVTKMPSKGLGRLKLFMRFGLNKIKFLQLV